MHKPQSLHKAEMVRFKVFISLGLRIYAMVIIISCACAGPFSSGTIFASPILASTPPIMQSTVPPPIPDNPPRTEPNPESDFAYILLGNLGDKVAIISYWGPQGDVVIPATIWGRQVTNIGNDAFSKNRITRMTIPNGVVSIGDMAFSGCSHMVSISIPDSVTIIGNDAFRDCSSLTSIVIPDSVTSIGDGAFSDNLCLTVICSRSSYAHEYCKANHIEFKLIETTIPTTITTDSGNTSNVKTDFNWLIWLVCPLLLAGLVTLVVAWYNKRTR